jgi:hypothetical protein
VAEQRLGYAQAEVAGDVLSEGMPEAVRRDLALDAGPPRQVVHGALDGLRTHRSRRVLALKDVRAPPPRARAPQDVMVRRGACADVLHDALEFGNDGQPPLAAALGDVRGHVDVALAGEVAALQTTQLGGAQAGQQAQVRDALLADRHGLRQQPRHLFGGQPVAAYGGGFRAAHLLGRVRLADPLVDAPLIEACEDAMALGLRARVRPAAQRPLDVLAADGARIAVADSAWFIKTCR